MSELLNPTNGRTVLEEAQNLEADFGERAGDVVARIMYAMSAWDENSYWGQVATLIAAREQTARIERRKGGEQ